MEKKAIKNPENNFMYTIQLTKKWRYLSVFMAFVLPIICKSQTNGLAVDMQYEQRIQDARRQNEELNNSFAVRYKKFKDDYIYALGVNEIKDNPLRLSNSGSYNVIITNSGKIFEKVEVFILNNKVISVTLHNGDVVTPKSCSVIQNFRCIVVMPDGIYLEVFFTDLFK